jgi:hypothetical protein
MEMQAMSRPLEHHAFVGLRLPATMADAFTTAATSLGLSKSEFARALIMQALRNENLARAAVDDAGLTRPAYPQFVSALV